MLWNVFYNSVKNCKLRRNFLGCSNIVLDMEEINNNKKKCIRFTALLFCVSIKTFLFLNLRSAQKCHMRVNYLWNCLIIILRHCVHNDNTFGSYLCKQSMLQYTSCFVTKNVINCYWRCVSNDRLKKIKFQYYFTFVLILWLCFFLNAYCNFQECTTTVKTTINELCVIRV